MGNESVASGCALLLSVGLALGACGDSFLFLEGPVNDSGLGGGGEGGAPDDLTSSTTISSSAATNGSGVGGFGGVGAMGGGAMGGFGGQPPTGCDALNPPEGSPTECSMFSSVNVTVTFENHCRTEAIDFFWVNYACLEEKYGTLQPGESVTQNSYATHPWRIRETNSKKLLLTTMPLPDQDTVISVP